MLEAVRGHRLVVVEGGPVQQVEGVLGVLSVGSVGLCGQALKRVVAMIVPGQRGKEASRHLTGGLVLGKRRVDGRRRSDAAAQRAAAVGVVGGLGLGLLGAGINRPGATR